MLTDQQLDEIIASKGMKPYNPASSGGGGLRGQALVDSLRQKRAPSMQPAEKPGMFDSAVDAIDDSYLGKTADALNSAYEWYKGTLPGKALQGAGHAVGQVAGNVFGGIGGGIGQAGKNLIEGKPLTENVWESAKQAGKETGDAASQMAGEGFVAAPLGGAGKVVGGLMAVGQGKAALDTLKNAQTEEDYMNGALQLATALLGAHGARGKGIAGGTGAEFSPGKIAGKVTEKIPGIKELGTLPEKAADFISPIPESVKTELTRGSVEGNIPKQEQIVVRNQEHMRAAREATKDNSKSTPMELAGQEGEKALATLKQKLSEHGEMKQSALNESGTKIVPIADSGFKFQDLAEQRLGTRFEIKPGGEIVFNDAPGRKSLIKQSSSDTNLVRKVHNTLKDLGENPTLQEVNDAVDSIQSELYKTKGVGAEPINGKTEAVLKQVVGDLNDRAKEVGGDTYKEANARYTEARDIHDVLNKALGEDANKGAALMKQLFSPNGTMARNLFADIKRLTGIDLVSEATLAKNAMETAGDVRQKSLLGDIVGSGAPSLRGTMGKILDFGAKKLADPVKRSNKIAEKSLKDMKKERK